jgi:hypothetical protein
MDSELLSGIIAGGLGGVTREYGEQRQRKDRLKEIAEQHRAQQQEVDRKKAVDAANESERQRQLQAQQEIIEGMPDTLQDGSPNPIKMALRVQYASPKGTLGNTIVTESGRNARYDRPSGNAIANNQGAMDRVGAQIKGALDRTTLEENGRNTRWAAPSGNATLGAQTTRRGQDMTAGTARRGQDLDFSLGTDRNAVAQRGQDINFGLGAQRNDIANRKRSIFDATFGDQPQGADPNTPPTAPAAQAPTLPPRVPSGGGGGNLSMTTQTMAKPNDGGPSRPVGGPVPVTPRGAAPPAQAALATLTAQATAMLAAFKAEQDPAKKRQLQAQLLELKKRKDALLASAGGGQ